MKEQVQETGVRKYFGDDFITLQNEILTAMTAEFSNYGSFILSGCEVTDNGATWDIAPGIVFLFAPGGLTPKICRFAGGTYQSAENPVYLVQDTKDRVDVPAYGRVYKDAQTKNIIVEYYAKAQLALPIFSDYITINKAGGAKKYLDAIQNATHRFLTDAQIATFNNKFDETSGVPAFAQQVGSEYTASSTANVTATIPKDRTELYLTQIVNTGNTNTSEYTIDPTTKTLYIKLLLFIHAGGSAGTLRVKAGSTIIAEITEPQAGQYTRHWYLVKVGTAWIKVIAGTGADPAI